MLYPPPCVDPGRTVWLTRSCSLRSPSLPRRRQLSVPAVAETTARVSTPAPCSHWGVAESEPRARSPRFPALFVIVPTSTPHTHTHSASPCRFWINKRSRSLSRDGLEHRGSPYSETTACGLLTRGQPSHCLHIKGMAVPDRIRGFSRAATTQCLQIPVPAVLS